MQLNTPTIPFMIDLMIDLIILLTTVTSALREAFYAPHGKHNKCLALVILEYKVHYIKSTQIFDLISAHQAHSLGRRPPPIIDADAQNAPPEPPVNPQLVFQPYYPTFPYPIYYFPVCICRSLSLVS